MRAQERLGKFVSVRSAPSAYAPRIDPQIAPYSVVNYIAIVHDIDTDKKDSPDYMWFDQGGGKFIAYIYPPAIDRFELLDDTPPPPVANPLIRPIVVPPGKKVGWVLWNFERGPNYVSRPTMNGNNNPLVKGLPDTCPLWRVMNSPLLGRMQQEFWYHWLKESAGTTMSDHDLRAAWANLTSDDRAFTNGAGSDTRADYINGRNLNAGPMRFIPMGMGGSIHDITDGPVLIAGQNCWVVRTVNYLKPVVDAYTLMWATNSCRDQINLWTRKWAEEKIENEFPQLRGANVPVPMFTVGDTGWIPCSRVRVLNAGTAIPSPYWTP